MTESVGAGLVPGSVTDLFPGIRRILAPNPSLLTGPGTNTYLVGTTELVAIDPGPDDADHLDLVAAAAGGALKYILVTHTHSDHAPGARGLGERTGATVLGYDARDGFSPDADLTDGDVVAVEGFRLLALHTPGHASNHLCYLAEETSPFRAPSRLLFSGDQVMGGSTVVIAPPDGDMAAYLESLTRLARLDPPISAIAPGHGPLLCSPAEVLASYRAHRLEREAEVLRVLREAGPTTVDAIVAEVYASTAPELHPIARYSVWAHLNKLAAEGRALCTGAHATDGLTKSWQALGEEPLTTETAPGEPAPR